MAWILLTLLCLSLAPRPTAFMFPSRTSSLLQSRLCKVSLWLVVDEMLLLVMQFEVPQHQLNFNYAEKSFLLAFFVLKKAL